MNKQCARVLHHMQNVGPITSRTARDLYGIERLGARIWDLRQAGIEIKDQFVEGVNKYGDKTHFKEYWTPRA